MNIAVLGGGAWGTALAIYLAHDHQIAFWCREAEVLKDIAEIHENRQFLKGYRVPNNVLPKATIPQAIQNADLILIATPTAGFRPTLEILKSEKTSAPILWACKGFEAKTSLLPHQVLSEVLGDYPAAVLSGPSFAQEVAAGEPCAVSMAANRPNLAQELALKLHRPNFRIYANDDLIGVEVGAATKNVLAIATGICDGLKMGNNTRAALVTRGLAEIARLGVALGAKRETFMGLSGIGDILLTCTGDLSRNRQVGLKLGQGLPLPEILASLDHVAEGVSTAQEVLALAQKYQIEVPISKAVVAALSGKVGIAQIIENLLLRDNRTEMY